jgi:nucleoside-diphosphate-sugar epimerase
LDRIALPARAARDFAALPGRLRMLEGTVESEADLARAFGAAPVEAAVHCAVVTAGSAREAADPGGIVAVNVLGAVATLMAAKRAGADRFVYPSSGAVYGHAARGAAELDEETTGTAPASLYGLTKRAAETILPRIAETQGMRCVCLRFGSVYGPWEYATGVRDTLSPMLQALEAARAGREIVLGPAWKGDFVYSRDVGAGVVQVLDAPRWRRTVYNLGGGRFESAADWCAALARAMPGARWRLAAPGEAYEIESHTGFDRAKMRIDRIAGDCGVSPAFDFDAAARDWLGWLDRGG